MSSQIFKTHLIKTSPFWRSYFFPIFTKNQFYFFLGGFAIACVIGFFAGEFGPPLAIVLVLSVLGALSTTSPALLITNSSNLQQMSFALSAGGWVETSNGEWIRPPASSAWENDRVSILIQQSIIVVSGPYFTLRKLKAILGSAT